jgi:hypothetical protein
MPHGCDQRNSSLNAFTPNYRYQRGTSDLPIACSSRPSPQPSLLALLHHFGNIPLLLSSFLYSPFSYFFIIIFSYRYSFYSYPSFIPILLLFLLFFYFYLLLASICARFLFLL